MKRKKLKLEELKVQSFITELQPGVAHTAKGGDDATWDLVCTAASVKSVFDTLHYLTAVPRSCNPSRCDSTPPTLGPGGPVPTLTPPFSSNLTVSF